jgi:hypothetical protein
MERVSRKMGKYHFVLLWLRHCVIPECYFSETAKRLRNAQPAIYRLLRSRRGGCKVGHGLGWRIVPRTTRFGGMWHAHQHRESRCHYRTNYFKIEVDLERHIFVSSFSLAPHHSAIAVWHEHLEPTGAAPYPIDWYLSSWEIHD